MSRTTSYADLGIVGGYLGQCFTDVTAEDLKKFFTTDAEGYIIRDFSQDQVRDFWASHKSKAEVAGLTDVPTDMPDTWVGWMNSEKIAPTVRTVGTQRPESATDGTVETEDQAEETGYHYTRFVPNASQICVDTDGGLAGCRLVKWQGYRDPTYEPDAKFDHTDKHYLTCVKTCEKAEERTRAKAARKFISGF